MQVNPEEFHIQQAEAFKEHGVVDVYRYRAPYPPEVFDLLAGLLTGESRAVLDVCTGTGDVARPLISRVERIDAVDFSQNMLDQGKRMPDGDNPHLRWIYGKVEEVALDPPYGLVTAGSSIHWLEWKIVFPRFRSVLTPGGFVAVLGREMVPLAWSAELTELRNHYAVIKHHRAATAPREVIQEGFLTHVKTHETSPWSFPQAIDDYIEAQHSYSRFSRERIGIPRSYDYDREARAILLRYHPDGMLPLHVIGLVTWGIPAS